MFKIQVTDEQRYYAWDLVGKINMGNRGRNDGSKALQYLGILGETVMADLIGVARPDGSNSEQNKRGVDFYLFGKKVDLKTMVRDYEVNPKWFICNLMFEQVHNDYSETDIYAFASYNKQTQEMTFVGIISKKALNNNFLVPAGSVRHKGKESSFISKWDNYEVPISALLCADTPHEWLWNFDRI